MASGTSGEDRPRRPRRCCFACHRSEVAPIGRTLGWVRQRAWSAELRRARTRVLSHEHPASGTPNRHRWHTRNVTQQNPDRPGPCCIARRCRASARIGIAVLRFVLARTLESRIAHCTYELAPPTAGPWPPRVAPGTRPSTIGLSTNGKSCRNARTTDPAIRWSWSTCCSPAKRHSR